MHTLPWSSICRKCPTAASVKVQDKRQVTYSLFTLLLHSLQHKVAFPGVTPGDSAEPHRARLNNYKLVRRDHPLSADRAAIFQIFCHF